MYYKTLLHHVYTKRDLSGNVYGSVKVTNPRTGQSFCTETPSVGNVTNILRQFFAVDPAYSTNYITENCTGSTKLSSLPDCLYLDNCRLTADWIKALNSIGFRRGKK